jgi:hypothetical protein
MRGHRQTDASASFYVICLLLTRKKEERQTKQEKAKAVFGEIRSG